MHGIQRSADGACGEDLSARPPATGSLAWEERAQRKRDRAQRASRGLTTPRLRQVALVELDKIPVPQWARDKAIPGLTLTGDSVWLGRIAARALARLDESVGGRPRLTFEVYRPCRVCWRPLLGAMAEHRLELDRKFEGWRIPCGPECVEIEAVRRRRTHGPTPKLL